MYLIQRLVVSTAILFIPYMKFFYSHISQEKAKFRGRENKPCNYGYKSSHLYEVPGL